MGPTVCSSLNWLVSWSVTVTVFFIYEYISYVFREKELLIGKFCA
jgi:hypothetical protein